jgi:radical SAM protein with 4Fe4S-binding SPASM domain
VVTQVGRLNLEGLDETYQLLCQLGADRWLVHLCQAAGRARHHRRQLICTPSSLEFIVSLLLRVAREGRIIAPLTCSIGYLSAEEPLLRGRGGNRRPIWRGCGAGVQTLASTSRGGIKGCTTLPDEFVSSSLDQRTLAEIWADDEVFPYTRAWSRELLTGPCARCGLGERCRGGCPSVAYGATGSIGSNPYCLRLVRGQ